MMQTILALETSCDETAVSLVRLDAEELHVIANSIASQAEKHNQWGGVVPEIASRMHVEAMPFLVLEALSESGLTFKDIDYVAATVSPGLTGALLVGSITGRTLAALHNIPFLGIHHLEGHLASAFLAENPPRYPYLVLLVSGGHTELIMVRENCRFQRLGRSHDDAAGEAFDKVARLLGLPYPGGPAIQDIGKNGDPFKFSFPKGKVSKPEGGYYPYDFSFSGLKTAVLRETERLKTSGGILPIEDLAASFENAVAEVLVERSIRCALDHGISSLVMVGGVAANNRLRQMMTTKALEKSIEIHLAPKLFCTDNAAMIGAAALLRLSSGVKSSSLELGVSARWELDQSDLFYKDSPPF